MDPASNNKRVHLDLSVEDALRVANLLPQTTDRMFSDEGKLGSPEHRNAVSAQQKVYRQVHSQITPRDMQDVSKRFTVRERAYCGL